MSTRTESFLIGLIGDGITESLTPPMHEREADQHGVRYLYRPVDLTVNFLSPVEVRVPSRVFARGAVGSDGCGNSLRTS